MFPRVSVREKESLKEMLKETDEKMVGGNSWMEGF